MYSAKNDKLSLLLLGSDLAQFQAVAREVGKLENLIPLIMMAKYNQPFSQQFLYLPDKPERLVGVEILSFFR